MLSAGHETARDRLKDSTLLLEATFHVNSMPAWIGPAPSGTRGCAGPRQTVGHDLVPPLALLSVLDRDLWHLWLLNEKLDRTGTGSSRCGF